MEVIVITCSECQGVEPHKVRGNRASEASEKTSSCKEQSHNTSCTELFTPLAERHEERSSEQKETFNYRFTQGDEGLRDLVIESSSGVHLSVIIL